MVARLAPDVIDDPEEILDWFLEHGGALIRELLDLRQQGVHPSPASA